MVGADSNIISIVLFKWISLGPGGVRNICFLKVKGGCKIPTVHSARTTWRIQPPCVRGEGGLRIPLTVLLFKKDCESTKAMCGGNRDYARVQTVDSSF